MNGETRGNAIFSSTAALAAIRDALDLLLKAIAGMAGATYVLGLVVTNSHLVALGIADFSGLQARFVICGVLFVTYVGLLLVLSAGWTLGTKVVYGVLVEIFPTTSRRSLACAVIAASLVSWVSAVGWVLEVAIPWAPQEADTFGLLSFTWHLPDYLPHCVRAMAQLVSLDTAVLLIAMALAGTRLELSRKTIHELPSAVVLILVLGVALIHGYSQDVYPNVYYNLGGGQPRLAHLYWRADTDKGTIPSDLLGKGDTPTKESTLLLIWHQDSRFLYVSSIGPTEGRHGAPDLDAIDLNVVSGIRFVPGWTRVNGGATVSEVHAGS